MHRRAIERSLIPLFLAATLGAATGCAAPSSAALGEEAVFGASGGGAGGDATTGGQGGGDLFGTGGGTATSTGTGEALGTPVRLVPGLLSMTFFETTNVAVPYTFSVGGPELTTEIKGALGADGFDIPGAPTEFYDVYYSDEEGGFDVDGKYLTIAGVFENPAPAGGGLNLAEIALNYDDDTTELGNYVASFTALGDNSIAAAVDNCIDGDVATYTTMGNTLGSTERLRLTLGFLSTSGPPPDPH